MENGVYGAKFTLWKMECMVLSLHYGKWSVWCKVYTMENGVYGAAKFTLWKMVERSGLGRKATETEGLVIYIFILYIYIIYHPNAQECESETESKFTLN